MVYVKEVKRYDKDGNHKYSDYYLAKEVPTENGEYTTKILGRASEAQIEAYKNKQDVQYTAQSNEHTAQLEHQLAELTEQNKVLIGAIKKMLPAFIEAELEVAFSDEEFALVEAFVMEVQA